MHPEWGIFPRCTMAAIKAMAEKYDSSEYVFSCSCVDIYQWECYDLLNNRQKCKVSSDAGIEGYREVQLKTVNDVKKLINTAATHRVTNATKCNDTSSRSHAIATLRLTRFNKEDGTVLETSFVFADLSGSERQSKVSDDKAADAKTSMEGLAINWDLMGLSKQIEDNRAALIAKKKAPAGSQNWSLLIKCLKQSIDGKAYTSMVVCLSQAVHNGFESYYSSVYG